MIGLIRYGLFYNNRFNDEKIYCFDKYFSIRYRISESGDSIAALWSFYYGIGNLKCELTNGEDGEMIVIKDLKQLEDKPLIADGYYYTFRDWYYGEMERVVGYYKVYRNKGIGRFELKLVVGLLYLL